jgi:hypothetical protein
MANQRGDSVKTCDVEGCDNPAERSISGKKVEKAGLDIEESRGKVHLCREHYKEYKKSSKADRKLEALGR